MRLRGKITLAVFAVVALYSAIDYAVQRWVIFPQFLALEHVEAVEDVERCREAIQQELDHLGLLCRDWSSWDDTYQFMLDQNAAFQKSSLTPEAFQISNFNLVYFYRPSGEIIWGKSYELADLHEVALPEVDAYMQRNNRTFITHPTVNSNNSGLLMTRVGPMMLVALPVLTSEQQGPSRGTLVMGRLLSPALIQQISRQTRCPIIATVLEREQPSKLGRQALAMNGATAEPTILEVDQQKLAGFLHVQDIIGKPILQLQADIARDISLRGRQALRFTSWSLFAGGALVLCLLLFLIQRIVIAPITMLTKHATMVGASGDLSRRVELTSHDEIGFLAKEFNRMVDRLSDSYHRLIDLSRKAGMAQIASGVLHNIGNVLAGVGCLTDSLRNGIENSRMHKLPQLAELLQSHADELPRFIAEDPRGQQIVLYIGQLAARWQEESERFRFDVESLAANLQHIKSIVESQRQFTARTHPTEPTDLRKLIAEATLMCERGLERHGITLDKEVDDLPVVFVDRTRLLEVLVNLITNAKESLIDACSPSPAIHIHVTRLAEEGVRIEVRDNGGGVSSENLARIFEQGFTTKGGRGQGLGLHISALDIQEMGGRLTARSDGSGQGATFTIVLPCNAPASRSPILGWDDPIGLPPTPEPGLCLIRW